jgi:hypothetical protein
MKNVVNHRYRHKKNPRDFGSWIFIGAFKTSKYYLLTVNVRITETKEKIRIN